MNDIQILVVHSKGVHNFRGMIWWHSCFLVLSYYLKKKKKKKKILKTGFRLIQFSAPTCAHYAHQSFSKLSVKRNLSLLQRLKSTASK